MRTKYALALVVMLTAAISVGIFSCATVPPTNYYVLGRSDHAGQMSETLPYTIAIAPFESETTHMRKKIAWRSETGRLGYYPYDKWAALPAEMFAFRMYQRAHSSNLFSRVVSGTASDDVDFILQGELISFEEMDTPEGWFGAVEARVELLRRDGTIVWSGTASHMEPATEEAVDAVVKAIADATEATITEMLSSIEESLREIQP